jgi:LacI family transcriptional regulator
MTRDNILALRKRPTIKQIAKEAGVSISTVSNVLNGNLDEMSVATQERVEAVIKKLKYRPNQIARGLVTSRTATIGMILAEIETPLFLQALTSIEREARHAGYQLLLNHSRNEVEEQQALGLLLEKQVDGIIFFSTSNLNDSPLVELKDSLVPAVLINRFTQRNDISRVNWDNQNSVYAVVEYLVKLGHRHIAHLVGPEDRIGSQDRLRGYLHGLEAHGIEAREDYLQNGDFTLAPDVWRQSTRALLAMQPRPTAIIASDDLVAAVVIETLREEGVGIPAEISVVGIDNQPILAYLSLSTIDLPVVQAGITALELLLQRINHPDTEASHIMLPCNFIERKTTGPAPHINA